MARARCVPPGGFGDIPGSFRARVAFGRLAVGVLLYASVTDFTLAEPPADLAALLHANRHMLSIRNGALDGVGAALFRGALHDAPFVGIGEQHGTQEVPAFAAAVCRAMAPDGLDAVAVEAGLAAVAAIQPWTRRNWGADMLRVAEKAFPA